MDDPSRRGRVPPADASELKPFGDDEDEQFLTEEAEAEAEAVELLRRALPHLRTVPAPEDDLLAAAEAVRAGVAARTAPFPQIAAAAGWVGPPPSDDAELWLDATGALVAMRGEAGLPIDDEAAVLALQWTDWLGAVVGLVRAGVGASGRASDLVRHIAACPELDGGLDELDRPLLEQAFEVVLPTWQATCALDPEGRLTPLGQWGLPRALAWAWNGDFDVDLPG
ncbi:MAG TPA: hypothetical protein VKP64_16380 [Mycobacteriales bacterium]|nr:hypothetical protein [Mycobacteriales bacterium]